MTASFARRAASKSCSSACWTFWDCEPGTAKPPPVRFSDWRAANGRQQHEYPDHEDEPLAPAKHAVRLREPRVERLQAHAAVAAHDLDEQALLRAEVIVQQAARDARLARDVVKRRARRAALGHRRAHRIDEASGLVACQLALAPRRGLHSTDSLARWLAGQQRRRRR